MAPIDSSTVFFHPRVNLPTQTVKTINDPLEFPEVVCTFHRWIVKVKCRKRLEIIKTFESQTTKVKGG